MKWDAAKIRELEKTSIRKFVASASEFFAGKLVIDVGAGLQPYRDVVVKAGGEYVAFDLVKFPANVSRADFIPPPGQTYGAALCCQVLQYVPYPAQFLASLKDLLEPGGHLVLTFATCWDEVEPEDLFRYTLAGMGRLLQAGGWELLRNEHRACVELGGFKFWLGGGVIARKP